MAYSKKITFTKTGDKIKVIRLNAENPYIYFVKLLIYDKTGNIDDSFDYFDIRVSYSLFIKGNKTITSGLSFMSMKFDNDFMFDSQINEDLSKIERIEISVDVDESKDYNHIELHYEDFNFIENIENNQSFASHLETHKNQKILFSAPFGEGKSTFLKYFFEQNEDKYEVFKVFPVDYSVATNDDIFRYIKTDIIFQLMGKEVTFDKIHFSPSLLTQQYLLSDTKQVIKTLLKAGLSLSNETKGIVEAIGEIEKLISDLNTFKSKTELDKQSKALKYIEELYEEEGSLYEDNFYTQLIRELVEQLKSNTAKNTVLIIDDLDRMDPEHIFRILNVISAHCDSFNIQGQEYSNKFGFDKIIVVCDINNIRNIFQHRYGKKVHFDGYINKFYSSRIFEFNNEVYINEILKTLYSKSKNTKFRESLQYLKIFYEIGILAPRDLLKSFSDINLEEIHHIKYSMVTKSIRDRKILELSYWPLLSMLMSHFGKDDLISKLDTTKKSKQLNENLDNLCGELLIGLLNNNIKRGEKNYFHLNNRQFSIELESSFRDLYIKNLQLIIGVNPAMTYSFKETDFYELLIENIKLLES